MRQAASTATSASEPLPTSFLFVVISRTTSGNCCRRRDHDPEVPNPWTAEYTFAGTLYASVWKPSIPRVHWIIAFALKRLGSMNSFKATMVKYWFT